MTNAKFLYSAFYSYDNQRVIDFFERNGLRTKTERGNRVFPVSDHSCLLYTSTGHGLVDGNLVFVYSQNAAVLNGTIGELSLIHIFLSVTMRSRRSAV